METTKQHYDFHYWIDELIKAGKQKDPDKYTEGYIEKLKRAWRGQPITDLHIKVVNRRKEILSLQNQTT
jgi:hypothetical protein